MNDKNKIPDSLLVRMLKFIGYGLAVVAGLILLRLAMTPFHHAFWLIAEGFWEIISILARIFVWLLVAACIGWTVRELFSWLREKWRAPREGPSLKSVPRVLRKSGEESRKEKPRLVELLNEFLRLNRKLFVWGGQVQFYVEDVTRDQITIEISVGQNSHLRTGTDHMAQAQIAINIRNAMLNQLGDLLPCPKIKVFYTDEASGVHRKEFIWPFYDPKQDEFLLKSNSEPIIENVLKAREEHRAEFTREWDALATQSSGIVKPELELIQDGRGKGQRILITDDQAAVLETIKDTLEYFGYEVVALQSKTEALERLREIKPDLVTTDLGSPELGGLEFIRLVKELDPSIPVIVISGTLTAEDAREAIRLGVFDCLLKPFDIPLFLQTIERALKTRGSQAES